MKRRAAIVLVALTLVLASCGEHGWDCRSRIEAKYVEQGWEQPEAASLARGFCADHTSDDWELTER